MNSKTIKTILAIVIIILLIAGTFWVLNKDSEPSPATTTDTAADTTESPGTLQQEDVAATIANMDNLSTFVTAIEDTDSLALLREPGPYTIFVPIDDAFASLSQDRRDSLFESSDTQELTALLNYHIVDGTLLIAEMSDGQEITTRQGELLTVRIRDGATYLVDASGAEALLLQADIEATNGTVHVIDRVLQTP